MAIGAIAGVSWWGAACLPPGAMAGWHGHLAGRCAMAGCDIGAMVWCLGAILGGWYVCTHFGILYVKVTLKGCHVRALCFGQCSKTKNRLCYLGPVLRNNFSEFGVSFGVPFFTCVETQNCMFG